MLPPPSRPLRKHQQQEVTGGHHRSPPLQEHQQHPPQRTAFRQKVSSANKVAICTTTSARVGRRTLRELMHPASHNEEAYSVPIFQRRYCWNKPQWDMLWQDALQRNSIKHSLGRLTCTNVNNGTTTTAANTTRKVQRSIIIDGQQRFTTIALFLSAIRDALLALQNHESSSRQGDALLQSIHEMLFLDTNAMQDWISNDSAKNTLVEGIELDFCRLVPTFCDRSAYLAAILPHHAPQVQCFMKETYNPKWHRPLLAKQHFRNKIALLLESSETKSSPTPLQILEKLTGLLLDGIDMLYFPIDVHKGYQDGTEDSQVIYERLAIRDATWCKPRRKWEGHSMDGTDMIRNLFLGSFSRSPQKTHFYETYWLPFERMFQTTMEATNDEGNGEESLNIVLRAFLDESQSSLVISAASPSSRPSVIGGRLYRDFEEWMARDFQRWRQQGATAHDKKEECMRSSTVNSSALAETHALDVGRRLIEFASHRIQSKYTNTQ